MSDIYYAPEKHGLEQVAELDFSDGNYCFDLRVVWKRLSDGQLLSARDSGCSCPSPFEQVNVKDLAEVNSIGWLKEEIGDDDRGHVKAEDCAAFLKKVEDALPKKKRKGGK